MEDNTSLDATSTLVVGDIMTADPIIAEPDTTVEQVMALMQEASIRHVPIVDSGGILGVVSNRDLTFIHGLPGVFDKGGDRRIEEVLDAPVSVILKSRFLIDRDVVTIDRDAPLEQAVNILVGSKLGALPVVDDEELVGILSTVDVLRWTADNAL